MDLEQIVPDCLDVAPREQLTVIYNTKLVKLGVEFAPMEVKDVPEIHWNADPSKFYTLMMVDPDAPSQFCEVNHWLVVNIPGNDWRAGEEITSYIGAGPIKQTGLHRYIFLVFEQASGKQEFEKDVPRRKFSIREFAKKNSLGNAGWINFFKAQWDPSVDELRRKMEQKSQPPQRY